MKTRFAFLLSAAALVLLAPSAWAEDAARKPEDRPKLGIVVVDNLDHHGSAITAFDRLDIAFQKVAEQRRWPVMVMAERFAANMASFDTELRIFNQPIRHDMPGELTFRGWMILTDHGVKHDFGIVTFMYSTRPLENMDDVLNKIFLGAANAAADKIEPLLFPKPAAPRS
jgi:hypothetical protein